MTAYAERRPEGPVTPNSVSEVGQGILLGEEGQ